MKNKLLVSVLVLGLAVAGALVFWGKSEPEAIEFHVLNGTRSAYTLHLTVTNERDQLIGEVTVPLEPNTTGLGVQSRTLVVEFERFRVDAVLLKPDNPTPIARTSAPWPGEAGSAAGASSNKVAVEIEVQDIAGIVSLTFKGVL